MSDAKQKAKDQCQDTIFGDNNEYVWLAVACPERKHSTVKWSDSNYDTVKGPDEGGVVEGQYEGQLKHGADTRATDDFDAKMPLYLGLYDPKVKNKPYHLFRVLSWKRSKFHANNGHLYDYTAKEVSGAAMGRTTNIFASKADLIRYIDPNAPTGSGIIKLHSGWSDKRREKDNQVYQQVAEALHKILENHVDAERQRERRRKRQRTV